MPFDKAAHAVQLAACVDHTGDDLIFEGTAFKGNIGSTAPRGVPPLADLDVRNGLYLTAARHSAAFATRYPTAGSYFTTPSGYRYRVLQDHSQPRLAIFVITPGTAA